MSIILIITTSVADPLVMHLLYGKYWTEGNYGPLGPQGKTIHKPSFDVPRWHIAKRTFKLRLPSKDHYNSQNCAHICILGHDDV